MPLTLADKCNTWQYDLLFISDDDKIHLYLYDLDEDAEEENWFTAVSIKHDTIYEPKLNVPYPFKVQLKNVLCQKDVGSGTITGIGEDGDCIIEYMKNTRYSKKEYIRLDGHLHRFSDPASTLPLLIEDKKEQMKKVLPKPPLAPFPNTMSYSEYIDARDKNVKWYDSMTDVQQLLKHFLKLSPENRQHVKRICNTFEVEESNEWDFN